MELSLPEPGSGWARLHSGSYCLARPTPRTECQRLQIHLGEKRTGCSLPRVLV